MCLQLNARSWTPAQIVATGRLQTGPLQFARGSQLLVDETVLTNGQLAATGIHNLQVSCIGLLTFQPAQRILESCTT